MQSTDLIVLVVCVSLFGAVFIGSGIFGSFESMYGSITGLSIFGVSTPTHGNMQIVSGDTFLDMKFELSNKEYSFYYNSVDDNLLFDEGLIDLVIKEKIMWGNMTIGEEEYPYNVNVFKGEAEFNTPNGKIEFIPVDMGKDDISLDLVIDQNSLGIVDVDISSYGVMDLI